MFGLFTAFLAVGCGLTLTSRLMEPTAVGPAVAPDPAAVREPVVQVYGANVWGLRGRFAIHTWIATKARNASDYTVYQVIGWRLRRGLPVVSKTTDDPAQHWFGSPPILLHERRGAAAEPLIGAIARAVDDYPYADQYVMYPGPNSNSFTAWVALRVPELDLDLPAKAIGKNWMIEAYPDLP